MLQETLNIYFFDESLLEIALTHSSYHQQGKSNNQRLELLGDSVLGFIVTEYLFHKHKDFQEGKITKIKNYLVSEPVLSDFARQIDLGQYLIMSHAEESSGGADKDSSLADAFEALIGAIYLDQGKEVVSGFILSFIERILDQHEEGFISDYKSELQYLVQKKLKQYPEYRILKEEGPNHSKIFTIELVINGQPYAQAQGTTKKQAEQKAAEFVFEQIQSGLLSLD